MFTTYKNGLWKIIWPFSCQPTGKMPTLAKATHHLSKAFPICYSAHPWKEYSMVMRRVKAWHCMFEGGNLLNLNLTPVTNTPWSLDLQLHDQCGSVAEPSLLTSVRFIIPYLRELCQFAFVCAQHNMHSMCTHKKTDLAIPAWKKKHCFCMFLVLSLHGWCNL